MLIGGIARRGRRRWPRRAVAGRPDARADDARRGASPARRGRRSPALLRSCGRHQRGGHHAAAQLRRPRPHVLPDLRPVEGPERASGQPTTEPLADGARLPLIGWRPACTSASSSRSSPRSSIWLALALHDVGLPPAGRRRQRRGRPAGRPAGRRAAAVGDARRRRARRPRRHGRSSPAPSSSCGRASSPATATSASSPAGSAATTRCKVVARRAAAAAIAIGGDSLQIDAEPAGRQRQRPDGAGAAGGARRHRPPRTSEERPTMSLVTRGARPARVRGGTSILYAALGERSPSAPAWSTSAPRARCSPARSPPTPSASETGNPWVGVLAGALAGGAAGARCTPTVVLSAGRTSWPPASSCCSSASG